MTDGAVNRWRQRPPKDRADIAQHLKKVARSLRTRGRVALAEAYFDAADVLVQAAPLPPLTDAQAAVLRDYTIIDADDRAGADHDVWAREHEGLIGRGLLARVKVPGRHFLQVQISEAGLNALREYDRG